MAPLTEIVANIKTTNQAIEEKTSELMAMLGQLKGTNPESQKELEDFLKDLKL